MTEKFQGIVIDVRRHTDRHDIVTLYTRSHGRVAFLSPTAKGKEGRMRQARLLPLSVIETETRFKLTAELQRLGAITPLHVWGEIYAHPVKRLIALFLSEFLNRLLRESMPDSRLWDFLVDSLSYLDAMQKGVADYHIVFLASLLPFAGIQPDASGYRDGYMFDMRAGVFTFGSLRTTDILTGPEAAFAAKICRISFANARALRLNGTLRARILNTLLAYYGLHFPGVNGLKSLQIIHEIFQ